MRDSDAISSAKINFLFLSFKKEQNFECYLATALFLEGKAQLILWAGSQINHRLICVF